MISLSSFSFLLTELKKVTFEVSQDFFQTCVPKFLVSILEKCHFSEEFLGHVGLRDEVSLFESRKSEVLRPELRHGVEDLRGVGHDVRIHTLVRDRHDLHVGSDGGLDPTRRVLKHETRAGVDRLVEEACADQEDVRRWFSFSDVRMRPRRDVVELGERFAVARDLGLGACLLTTRRHCHWDLEKTKTF